MMKKTLTGLCAAASAAAVCAAETVISPEQLTFFNILPHQATSNAKSHAKNMIEYQKKTGNSIVLFTVFISPTGKDYKEKIQVYARHFAELQKELQGSNIKLGLLINTVLGHAVNKDKIGGFEQSVDANGNISRFCHLDKKYQQFLYDSIVAYAKLKPAFMLFDDDLRAHFMAPECFCPIHTREFNRRMGTDFTPEQFRKAVKDSVVGDKIYEAFLKLQRDSVDAIAKIARKAIDSVDPSIPSGGCMPGAFYRYAGETSTALAAKGQPRVMRICNGAYLEPGPRIFPEELITTLSLSTVYKDFGILLDEADNYPRNIYSRSATSMHTKICTSIMAGLKGAKLWWINAEDFNGELMHKNYLNVLAKHKNYHPALFAEVNKSELAGVIIPVHKHFKTYHPAAGKWEYFVNPGSWGATMFGMYGVPYRCSMNLTEDGIYALAGSDTVNRFTDEELKQLLSGTLLLDGSAAMEIQKRGFGKYLGVKAEKKTFKCSYEISEKYQIRIQSPYHSAIPYLSLTDQKTEVFTWFTHSQFIGSGDKKIAPAVTMFDNELGGRVCVASANLKDITWLCRGERKKWITHLLDKLNRKPFPYAVMNKQNIATLSRIGKDGSTLAIIVNLTYDPTDDIVIRHAAPVKKIERLMPNGKWVALKFKKKGMEYSFPCEINCYANAVIRVTPEK